jgi:integrase
MLAKRKPHKPALGSHLEWHGRKIRVVVRVPPSLNDTLGSKLRRTLDTANPELAEVLKHSVIQDLKASIYRTRNGSKSDPLIRNALAIRKGLEAMRLMPLPENEMEAAQRDNILIVASNLADEIREREGDARAEMFFGIAHGTAHPILHFMDQWIIASQFAPKTVPSMRQSIVTLDNWAKTKDDLPQTIEAITPRIASRFVEEVFETPGVVPTTANKLLSGLSSYWKWLLKTQRLNPDDHRNPWPQTRVAKTKHHRNEHKTTPRPFTDKEVRTLIAGITMQPMADMMRLSLATGMRLDEIAILKAGRVQDDKIEVRIGKSEAGSREFPLPSSVVAMLQDRAKGKTADAFVFHELPTQNNDARGRGAPVTQAFLRARRTLGVDDRSPGARQSRVTFHSCRRWFIRKAVEALENGAKGFTPWTIADVVGHNAAEDGPLKMTMGLYPGKASPKAMRACIEAVRLP